MYVLPQHEKLVKYGIFFLRLGSEEEGRNRKIEQKNLRGVGRQEDRSTNWKKEGSEGRSWGDKKKC